MNKTRKKEQSQHKKSLKRFIRNRRAVVGIAILILLITLSLLAPILATHSPTSMDLRNRLSSPSSENLLGTDENGRDVFSRLLYGGRITLGIGFISMFMAIIIGSLLGGVAGYYGGWIDVLIMRIVDAMLSFPLFFFMIVILAFIGPSSLNIIIIIAATSWMQPARIVRGEVLQTRTLEYVEAAHSIGASNWQIIIRHILPRSIPSIIVAATLGVSYAILTESALSYLGLGVVPPEPSWGAMLSKARSYMWQKPILAFYPGILIFLSVLAFNGIGDGLRDAFDPSHSE